MNRFKGNEGRIQNIEDIKRDLDRAVDEKYAIIEIATQKKDGNRTDERY